MKEPTKKIYKLRLMSDMFAIPEDRFDDFLIDLKQWHKVAGNFNELTKIVAKAANEPLPEDYMIMKWKDDGIHKGKVTINVGQKPNQQED